MHKIFPLLSACLIAAPLLLAGGCASARSGPEIAAVFDSGVAAYDAGRYEEAYKIWWSIRTEDLAAMRNVAFMLRRGQGVVADPGKALDIYEMAADAGLPTAQADLAVMLINGEAGKPDPRRALPYLQAAAAAQHPVAQFELGKLYEAGGPVPQDLEKARQLYDAAARKGVKDAAARLTVLGPPQKPLPSPPQATITPPRAPAPLPGQEQAQLAPPATLPAAPPPRPPAVPASP